MELRDIKELIKVIKEENLEDLKIDINGEKLHLINSSENKIVNVDSTPKVSTEVLTLEEIVKTEIIKSSNVSKIKLFHL